MGSLYNFLKGLFYYDSDVSSPMEFQYMRGQLLIMHSLGSWPEKRYSNGFFAGSKYNLLLIIVSVVINSLAFVYIWQNRHKTTFFDMGHHILCILLTSWVLQRLILTRTHKYQEMMRDYLLEFHLFYYKYQSQYSAKIYTLIHIISGTFTLNVLCQMALGMSLFNLKSLYNNYSRGMFSDQRPANSTFEHAVYLYSPDEFSYVNMTGYWILVIWNIPVSYFVTCGMCGFDLLVSTIVLQILGHLEILKYNLLAIPLPTGVGKDGMYSKEENIQIGQHLMENIVHHKVIVKFVDKCSHALSEYLFSFYLFLQVITCILLLEISAMTSDALTKYLFLTIAMYQQLIQLSVFFEFINTKSTQLIDTVYSLPWECMDTSNRKTVLFLLHRVQTPLSLKAAKMVPVGVKTMSAVLRTTFTYYMVLMAVAGER